MLQKLFPDPFKEKNLSRYILLIDHGSLPGCLYFIKCAICVLQMLDNQVATS